MGKNKELDYNLFLLLYINRDDIKDWTSTSFCIGKFAYATNRNVMIKVPKNKTKLKKELSKEHQEVVLELFNRKINLNYKISVDKLRKLLDTIDKVDEYKNVDQQNKCVECNGSGEVDWEYKYHEQSFDCPECSGAGTIDECKRIKTGNKIFSENHVVKIKKSGFNPKYLFDLVNIATVLKQKTIVLSSQITAFNASLFLIKDIEIIMMPMLIGKNAKIIRFKYS